MARYYGTPYRTFARWGFVDGRARKSAMILGLSRQGVVYGAGWALGHLFLEREIR